MRARVFLAFLAFAVLACPALAQSRHGGHGASLDRVLPQIRRTMPGTFYDAEGPFYSPDGRASYRIKWMTPDGRIVWFYADARTGRVLHMGGNRAYGGRGGRYHDRYGDRNRDRYGNGYPGRHGDRDDWRGNRGNGGRDHWRGDNDDGWRGGYGSRGTRGRDWGSRGGRNGGRGGGRRGGHGGGHDGRGGRHGG